jgi:hypothetical protein
MSITFTGLVSSWADWYSDSTALSTAVTTLHLGGMLLGGGLAIAADRATLRALRQRRGLAEHLDSLESLHRPVLIGLGLTVVTGIGMLFADLQTLIGSPVFWVKMGMLLVLLANGARLRSAARRLRAQTASDRLRGRLRATAYASAFLWFTLLVLGATLPAV